MWEPLHCFIVGSERYIKTDSDGSVMKTPSLVGDWNVSIGVTYKIEGNAELELYIDGSSNIQSTDYPHYNSDRHLHTEYFNFSGTSGEKVL